MAATRMTLSDLEGEIVLTTTPLECTTRHETNVEEASIHKSAKINTYLLKNPRLHYFLMTRDFDI